MASRIPWFFHPIFVFVFSILALASSLILYIYWYVRVSAGLQALGRYYHIDPSQFLEAETWVVILVLSLLVTVILAGTLIIFIYSQKMVRLNRLQHEFINNFTHELKTPVTSLKLYLETFRKHDLPREDEVKYIGYMLQDVERLSQDVNRILNLAKIETKTFGGEFAPLDLVSFVEEFVRQIRHVFVNCDIEVHKPPGQSFYYPVNEPLLEMFLMNILTNAVKYNDNEKPRIDIRFLQERKRLHIRFEDNGMGIESKERKKIFRKFYQAGNANAYYPRGTGLGLYLVQNIAKMHKGKVTAENRQDAQGTAFTLILPFPRR